MDAKNDLTGTQKVGVVLTLIGSVVIAIVIMAFVLEKLGGAIGRGPTVVAIGGAVVAVGLSILFIAKKR